jgi:hypothetical protein
MRRVYRKPSGAVTRSPRRQRPTAYARMVPPRFQECSLSVPRTLLERSRQRPEHLTASARRPPAGLRLAAAADRGCHPSIIGAACSASAKLFGRIELRIGAGEGNRTLVCSLGSCRSTIELRPQSRFPDFWLRFWLRIVAGRAGLANGSGNAESPRANRISAAPGVRTDARGSSVRWLACRHVNTMRGNSFASRWLAGPAVPPLSQPRRRWRNPLCPCRPVW